MDAAELKMLVEGEEKKMEDTEEEFKAEVQKLQDRYSALSTKKDEKITAIKGSGLGLMKSVSKHKDSVVDSKDEL